MNHKIIKNEEETFELFFYDKEHKPCDEEKAYMVSISQYDKDGKFVKSVLGLVDNNEKQNNPRKVWYRPHKVGAGGKD